MNNKEALKLFNKILLVFIFQFACFSFHSLESIVIDDSKGKYPIGPHLEYYEDTTKKVTIDEINTHDMQNKFLVSNKIIPVFRYNDSNYWVRFKIKNDSTTQKKWLLKIEYTWFNNIEFYTQGNDGFFIKKQTGFLLPVKTRDVKSRKMVFSFILDHGEEKTYYLKLFSTTAINLQMTVYSYDKFLQEDHESQIIYGILYGILIIMIFYNLFLFFVLRDKSYLYYSFFVVFFTILMSMLHLHFYEYLPSFLNLKKHYTFYFIQGMVNITGILFTASFLMTKKNNPFIHKFVQANVILNTLMIICSWLVNVTIVIHINNILVFFAVSTAFIAGIISLYKGNRSARFYLLSWGIFLFGNIISQILQFIFADFSYYYYYFLMVGGVLNVILLSIALADRYRLIRLEKEKVERINIEQTEFFINLSHEIKTPLTLISNYLEKYLKDRELSKELKIIKQNIDKLLVDMINFFDVLKFQKGLHIYYNDKIINLSDFLKVKVELFTSTALNHKITITNNIEENVFIKIDPAALDRIINNIIENAIRYNKEEGKIDITLKSINDKIEFIVSDTGIGMNKDQADKIFLPYYQISHKKSNIQGIGMGLSIVKNIINDIKGEIFVESRFNEGSSFKIIFERYLPNEEDVIYTQIKKFYPAISFPTSEDPCKEEEVINEDNYNILIVEDNREILYLLKDKMKDSYNVYCALSGIEALKKLENMPVPDVIVSDIMMDNMDGYQLFDNIHNKNGYNDIPFIFITAKTTIDEKIRALKKGAIDFIFKPFVIEELISKIDTLIKFQELKKDNFEKEKFASIGMLLGGISHEIYNPLSGITGPLDNLRKNINSSKKPDKEKINKYIDYIEKNTQRIDNIIKNVRTLYKKEEFAKEKLDLNDIAYSVIENYKTDPGNKIDFEIIINKKIEIIGDGNALYQVLNNLVSNAIDSINKISGQGRISIILEKSNNNNNKIIKVIDNGSGIITKDIDKIFNAFYTTKSIGNNIGLGLYIVKDLIIKLGWEIKVSSEEGKGTTFCIIVKE